MSLSKNIKQLKVDEQLKINLARHLSNGGLAYGGDGLALLVESDQRMDLAKFQNWIARNLKAVNP